MRRGRGLGVLGSLGLGAGLMYVFDPQAGNRRRALLRDKLVHWMKQVEAGGEATARDMRNRASGAAAELRARVRPAVASEEVVAERVRAELGRVVSHPGSIDVSVRDGIVVLEGVVLAREEAGLLAAVQAVPGVQGLQSRLRVYESAEGVPELQGGVPRQPRPELRQTHWSPAWRVATAAAGTAFLAKGASRLGLPGALSTLAGLALLGRSATNLPLKRLLGIGAGRRAVDVVKTIEIGAPIDDVYRLWSDFESFPRFMANVRDVRDLGGGRSRWTVAGPAGVPVVYDAVVTRRVPNEVLAWKTEAGAPVEHAGLVRFEPGRTGGTRIHVRMSYNPPAGAVGHGVATILGVDPKSHMDADLARLKTLLETGRPARDAARRAGT